MDEVYKQAVDMQDKLHNYLDQPDSSAGQSLKQTVQRLIDDIRSQKNNISVEETVKDFISILDSIKDYDIIDYQDIDDLKDRCEDMRNALHKL